MTLAHLQNEELEKEEKEPLDMKAHCQGALSQPSLQLYEIRYFSSSERACTQAVTACRWECGKVSL